MKKELRDGLILRSLSEGIVSDAQNLGQFYVDVFAEDGDEDAETIRPWAEDLMSGNHPTMSLDDIWVVVDPSQNDRIVSALLLIPQTWRYDNIEIRVGRVELVATHIEYRRRGLVRELMTVAHDRSSSLGHIMQGILGIGHYYRRFGYAMAIDYGSNTQLPVVMIPKLKPEQKSRYSLRLAITSDIPNLLAWEAYEQKNSGLTVKRDEQYWAYDMNHSHREPPFSSDIYIVINTNGQAVGFVIFVMNEYNQTVSIRQYIIGEHSSYFDTFDDILRAIKAIADEFYATLPDDKYPTMINFDSAISSTVKAVIRKTDGGLMRDRMYAWYIRVENIPAFIKHITPVLERRLEGSGMNRFTGDLKVGFFQLNGIKISFDDGKITDIVASEMTQYESDTAMPYHTFLDILFGHRDWRELSYILPEVYANRKADILLMVLFPKMRTQIGEAIM